MRRPALIIMIFLSNLSFAQGWDSELEGRWNLFKIIDNMTGEEIQLTHKASEDYTYWINFNQNLVKFNLEINTCENEVVVGKDRSINFRYFSECTEMCCDDEFSKVLSYEESTKYYIKEGKTLILVSEDRIFYFTKVISEK